MKAKVYINVNPDYMKDKKYCPRYIPVLKQCSQYIEDEKKFIVDKQRFIEAMKEEYNLKGNIINRIYNTFLLYNVVDEDGMLTRSSEYFTTLPLKFAVTLSYELDDFQFKVYLFLLYSYNLYKTRRFNYNFSIADILRACGYNVCNKNYPKVKEALRILKNYNLIEYRERYIYNKTMTLDKVRTESD